MKQSRKESIAKLKTIHYAISKFVGDKEPTNQIKTWLLEVSLVLCSVIVELEENP